MKINSVSSSISHAQLGFHKISAKINLSDKRVERKISKALITPPCRYLFTILPSKRYYSVFPVAVLRRSISLARVLPPRKFMDHVSLIA